MTMGGSRVARPTGKGSRVFPGTDRRDLGWSWEVDFPEEERGPRVLQRVTDVPDGSQWARVRTEGVSPFERVEKTSSSFR